MIGQKQIHQKIQQLNFQDCHAKITQVDSQATLGNGVVVQVTGELSNAGQPMRRFTQTFVLAAQSPKKYYVHNDIFRYQDEVFTDEECEAESGRSEADDEMSRPPPSSTTPTAPDQPQAPLSNYYSSGVSPAPGLTVPSPQQHVAQTGVPATGVVPSVPVPQAPTQQTAMNGALHPDDVLSSPPQQHIVPQPTAPSQNTGSHLPLAPPHQVI